jgi:hypothetical protein
VAAGGVAAGKMMAAEHGAWICFEDEANRTLRPPKARTWARRGRTPVIPCPVRDPAGSRWQVWSASSPDNAHACSIGSRSIVPQGRATQLRRDRLRRPPGCRPPVPQGADRGHLGQPQHPHQRRDARPGRGAGLAHVIQLPAYGRPWRPPGWARRPICRSTPG